MKAPQFLIIVSACVLTAMAGISACHAAKAPAQKNLKKTNVAMIIAPDKFRDEELLVPLAAFKNAGFNVTVFSEKTGKITGMLGAKFTPDKKLSQINIKNFDAIVFIGGSGASVYWNNGFCHKICRDTVKQNKILAAICISPVTLAKSGVLKGKKATVWPGVSKMLIENGVKYVNKPVVLDGKIITANGPKAASEFATAIISKLNSTK